MGTIWDNQFVLRYWFSCKIVNFVIWELMNILQNTQGTFLFSHWRRNQSNTFFTGGESIATVKSSHLAVESLLFLTRHPYLIHLLQIWVSSFKCDIVLLQWFMLHDLHDRITIYFSSVGSKKKIKISLYVWNLTLAEAMICNGHFKWLV